MCRAIMILLALCGSSFVAAAPLEGQALFDNQGHLTAYLYADGKQDLYSYDSSWRLTSFTGRDGVTTQYS